MPLRGLYHSSQCFCLIPSILYRYWLSLVGVPQYQHVSVHQKSTSCPLLMPTERKRQGRGTSKHTRWHRQKEQGQLLLPVPHAHSFTHTHTHAIADSHLIFLCASLKRSQHTLIHPLEFALSSVFLLSCISIPSASLPDQSYRAEFPMVTHLIHINHKKKR